MLAVLCLCAGGAVLYQQSQPGGDGTGSTLPGVIIKKPTVLGWKVLNENDAESGTTIPPDMNVVFRLPLDMEPTPKAVLFGQKDKIVRYWGYCFADNYSADTVQSQMKYGQLPGRIFLSQAEIDARQKAYQATLPVYSIYNPPTTQQQLSAATASNPSIIKNQIDVFDPGMVCYIMTSAPLAFGVDSDGDLLNNKLEKEIGTDIASPDTDQDGISDGVEYLHGTLPKVRDTDGDGLVDGLEDQNWNGVVDRGETDPREQDSDKDGLCDGVCRVKLGHGQEVMLGEDMNLDGKVDNGETDPLKWSTRGDGVSDYQAYINCQLGQKNYCTSGQ